MWRTKCLYKKRSIRGVPRHTYTFFIVSRVWVKVDGVFIGNWNYHLPIVTTSNYSTIANSHTMQFTTACTKSSQSSVSTSRCLVTTSTSDVPLTLGSRIIPLPQLPTTAHNDWTTVPWLTHQRTLHFPALHWLSLIVLLITSPHRKHRSTVAVQLLLNGQHRKHRFPVSL
jgi:hypothetical protein